MKVSQIKREFRFKDQVFEDPNSKMDVQQVKEFYSNTFPELTNAVWETEANENHTVETITFKTSVGKKG